MPHYKKRCKFIWSEEDRVLKHNNKNQESDIKSPHKHLVALCRLSYVGSSGNCRKF